MAASPPTPLAALDLMYLPPRVAASRGPSAPRVIGWVPLRAARARAFVSNVAGMSMTADAVTGPSMVRELQVSQV